MTLAAAQPNVFGIQEGSSKPGPMPIGRRSQSQDLPNVSLTAEAARSIEVLDKSKVRMIDLIVQDDLQDPNADDVRDSVDAILGKNIAEMPIFVLTVAPENRVSSQIIAEIDQMKAGAEDDETIPTDFAYQNAHAIIQSAYAQADPGRTVPRFNPIPWATTDDVGGIRVLWDFSGRKLRANFGASPALKTYLYFESARESDSEALNAESLSRRLKWLTER
jgi:hypothetical protein